MVCAFECTQARSLFAMRLISLMKLALLAEPEAFFDHPY